MRKLIGTTVMTLVMAVPAFAQERLFVPDINCDKPYVVKGGDTLWNLSELKLRNPTLWSWVVEQNPILQESGRSFTRDDGVEVVRIYPGEELFCLEEAGLIQSEETGNTIVVPPSLSVPVVEKNFFERYLGDWWWLLALIGLVALAAWWLNRELKKDPVNSGPPQVNGGVTSVAQATERFGDRGRANNFTVLSVIPGTIHGVMKVSYGDGTERPRTMNGERAFQATVRHSDGQVDNIFMLQACGNDLRFGSISRYIPGPGFRFVPDTAAAAMTSTSVESAPASETSTPASGKPELKIELKPAEREGDASMIRILGAPTKNMVVSVSEDEFTLRFYPPKN